jgi:hypothetical protein
VRCNAAFGIPVIKGAANHCKVKIPPGEYRPDATGFIEYHPPRPGFITNRRPVQESKSLKIQAAPRDCVERMDGKLAKMARYDLNRCHIPSSLLQKALYLAFGASPSTFFLKGRDPFAIYLLQMSSLNN